MGNILIHKTTTWSWMDKNKDDSKVIAVDGNAASMINQREIIYNHDHYDIASVKKSGNKTIYYCYKDSKEDDLWKIFRQVAKNSGSNKDSNSSWTKVFFMIALLPESSYHNLLIPVAVNLQDCSFLYDAPLSSPFSPPPSVV